MTSPLASPLTNAPSRHFTQSRGTVRIVFGRGALGALGDELDRLSRARVFVVSTPGRASLAQRVVASLGKRGIATFTGAKEHVPVGVVDEAQAALERASADCIVAIGGGSAIGLGKALALRAPTATLVHLAVIADHRYTWVAVWK